MINRTLLVLLIVYSFSEAARGNFISEHHFTPTPGKSACACKTMEKASLDLILELLKEVRDNYPVCPPKPLPIDCEDVLRSGENKSGVYKVLPWNRVFTNPIEVYCDMDTDGGGWTVIQRRGDFLRQKDFFFQDWQAYKEGFGNLEKDFWLGNDNIFALSNQRPYSARFDLQDVEGNRRYALYDSFWIDDENQKYMLHINGYSGDAGDSMTSSHNGQKFSTKDQKNDNGGDSVDCAAYWKSGWWYNWCFSANLNGLYHRGKSENYKDGIIWRSWRGSEESLGWTEIKIRNKDFRK